MEITEIKPNEGQQAAIDGLLAWINIPDENRKKPQDWCAALTGGAGSGKTFTIKYVLDNCNISKSKIIVSAPTHKAKKVVIASTEIRGETAHALLALKPNLDLELFDINNPEFSTGKNPKLADYRNGILAFDESSMLNEELFKKLLQTAINNRVKIIFIGK